MRLRIGKIAYENLFPIFYMLQAEFDSPDYEYIEGVPSDLNCKIRNGEIDVSPSSSIEYLRNKNLYRLIENNSISSSGPVKSIYLFSRTPIEQLNDRVVLTSSQSETSVALIQVILRKFYGMDCTFRSASVPVDEALKSAAAYLLIGDEALVEVHKPRDLHIYDIGDLWYRNTGLPATFALWIVREACYLEKRGLVERFSHDLDRARVEALRNLDRIAEASAMRTVLSRAELVAYWEGISYEFNEEHRKGLALFERYARELGLV
ncbi:MAG: menaquinone biosynthesis protein [Candidatus Sulfobium sp.]